MAVSGYILLKIASRCNLDCKYCYWFRDKSVYEKPKFIEEDVIDALIEKLERHIIQNKIPKFEFIFHGGEPLLLPKERFVSLLNRLKQLESITQCFFQFSTATNGVLVDDEWCDIFKKYNVKVAVSIDGPEEINDKNRPWLNQKGSYKDSVKGLRFLQNAGIKPAILAVCDPSSDPVRTLKHFVEDLGVQYCDILVPDYNFNDKVEPISNYYISLFDYWYDNYLDKGIEVRFLSGLIRGVLGLQPNSDSLGYAPIHTVTLLTDGSLEPLDVLRIAGYESTKTKYNIKTHTISDVRDDAKWKQAYESSLKLCETCQNCEFKFACGGGHLSQRWSSDNGYDNPSVYCSDFKLIFRHVINKVSQDLIISE